MYFIICALRGSSHPYTGLADAIESLGELRRWESVFFLNTCMTITQIRGKLRLYLDPSDALLIARLDGNFGTLGVAGDCADWLYANVAR